MLYRPQTYQELYNKRHAALRNYIERIFGVTKKKFKVMEHGSHYPIHIQVRLVLLMAFIYNFIRKEDGEDENFRGEFDIDFQPQVNQEELHAAGNTPEESTEAGKLRTKIAKAMWRKYCQKRAARGM